MARNLRPLDIFPITTRTLQVLRVVDVTPGMRRVTLGGPELAAHIAANGYPVQAFHSDGFDDEFKLLLPHPDAEGIVGPTQADGMLDWPRGDERMVMRTYTVRRWDPLAGELDVDFVVHGVGPATSWAHTVRPGESVQIAGPKMSARHPDGVDWLLVAGDETALPAIARWLDEWPAGARGQVFIEVAGPAHEQDVARPEGVEITWLHRDGATAGTTDLLFSALRAMPWWEGKPFAWLAGEALALAPIRRWLRGDRGLAKEQIDVTGYWRRQAVVLADDDDTRIDLDATVDDAEALHALAEIVPAFAVRVAATIGLAAAFDGSERRVEELAIATGASADGLVRLLRYLVAIGIVEEPSPDLFRPTALGRGLENEHLVEHLDLTGPVARRETAAMRVLLDAVRAADARPAGPAFIAAERDDPLLLFDRLAHDADDGVYVAGALAQSVSFDTPAKVVVAGIDPGGFAEALVRVHATLRVTIVAAPAEIDALHALHPAHDRIMHEAGSLLHVRQAPVNAVLLADALRAVADADAVHILRHAAASVVAGGRLLLFCETIEHGLADEHDYEEDLILFALPE